MTAYELANELAFKHIAGDDSGLFNIQLTDMLRKQQNQIELLQKQVDRLKEIIEKSIDMNNALARL